MIKEVLGLGISGQDLVLSTINRVKQAKDQLAKKTEVTLSVGMTGQQIVTSQKQPENREEDRKQERRDRYEDEKLRRFTEPGLGAAQGLSTLNSVNATKALIEAAGSMGGQIGQVISTLAGLTIDAGITFKEQVKQASFTVADSADATSRALNILHDQYFLRNTQNPADKTSRVDIDVNTQRALVDALGSKYGTLTDELRDQITRIFGTRQNPTDVRQASQVAMGNFSALGNDRGWFLQKIADSFSGMPPSIRQKMMSQMIGQINPEEMYKQKDSGIRAVTTGFDDLKRERAAMITGGPNIGKAMAIEGLVNTEDAKMINAMGTLITAVQKVGIAADQTTKAVERVISGINQGFNELNKQGMKGAPSGR